MSGDRQNSSSTAVRQRYSLAAMAELVPDGQRAAARHFVGAVSGLSQRDADELATAVNEWLEGALLRAMHALPPVGLERHRDYR